MSGTPTSVSVREEICIEATPKTCGVVIFGGSGDLAHRKLLPSLFSLQKRGLLPESTYICGCLSYGDDQTTDEEYQNKVRHDLSEKFTDASGEEIETFVGRLSYSPGAFDETRTYTGLAEKLKTLDSKFGLDGQYVFYLAVPPTIFPAIISKMAETGLTKSNNHPGNPRVVIEKPFGHSPESARKLSRMVRAVLDEEQIYRIDHYLGKETVQNILMLRFANSIFEPLWNNAHIDHVQITTAEAIGVEHRAGYYDGAGCLRDMFQNHMLQMLALTAMEPPAAFEADLYRDEKVKLLRAIRPFPSNPEELAKLVVRGQYGDSPGVDGYRGETGVGEDSNTETFVAMKLMVDNWRWAGVPFYLRSGKRLRRRVSEIVITFKRLPHSIFPPVTPEMLSPNVLVLNVQPEEGISLGIEAKRPGPKTCMGTLTMHFDYRRVFGVEPPEAYERLLLDCMLGDQSLFVRTDGLTAAWDLLAPVLNVWGDSREAPEKYPAGSWGPECADRLLWADSRYWREP